MRNESLATVDESMEGSALIDTELAHDYEQACRWFGWMRFAEFAAGYRAMEAWHAHRKPTLVKRGETS